MFGSFLVLFLWLFILFVIIASILFVYIFSFYIKFSTFEKYAKNKYGTPNYSCTVPITLFNNIFSGIGVYVKLEFHNNFILLKLFDNCIRQNINEITIKKSLICSYLTIKQKNIKITCAVDNDLVDKYLKY